MGTWVKAQLRSSLFVNTFLLVLIRLFGTGFSFLFWALAARTLAADEVGLASGAVSAAALLAGLAQLGLGYGLVRHLAHSGDPNGLLNLSIVMSGLTGFGLALLFLVSLPICSPALRPLRANLFSNQLFVVLVFSTTLSQLLHWVFLAARRLTFSLIKQTTQALLAIILLLVLRFLISDYTSAITAYTIATVLSLGLSFWAFLPITQPGYCFRIPIKTAIRSRFTGYSFANFAADQFQRAPDTLLPLIALHQLGPSAGAYFFVAWTMGRSMGAWAGSVAESLFTEGSNAPAVAPTYFRRSVRLGMLLAGGLVLAMVLGGELLLATYGQDYAVHGTGLLHYVTFAAIPGVMLSILVSLLRVQDRLGTVFTISAANATGGVLLCWAGMVWSGLAGAGIGWLLSQGAMLSIGAGWWRYRHSRQPSHASILDKSTQTLGQVLE